MTHEGFLERLSEVRVHRRHGQRAPHKPLMLLLALGRVGLGPQERLIPYETADSRFRGLWQEFGRPGTPPRAHYPFGRLRNDDDLWEIRGESKLSTASDQDLLVSEAERFGIKGGFRREVHDLLLHDPTLVSRAAHQILSEHFPSSIHHDILEAVHLDPSPRTSDRDAPTPRRGRMVREYAPRDTRFRKDVLDAYDERCVVCEYDIRFGDRVLGLEAAHIWWHSHDGADTVPNGLALCPGHHKALDCGALGLDTKPRGFRILISSKVHGSSPSTRRLLGFRGKPIRPPVNPSDAPNPRFVAWHRAEVFHP